MGDESIFTDAARYIEIVQLIKEKGYTTVPTSDELSKLVINKIGLKGWLDQRAKSIQFRARLEIFFARTLAR
jgi:hypothetical protein